MGDGRVHPEVADARAGRTAEDHRRRLATAVLVALLVTLTLIVAMWWAAVGTDCAPLLDAGVDGVCA